MEMALTFILVFTIYTVAFELIPKPSPSFKYKADAKGLTLYSVSPQVCCVRSRLFCAQKLLHRTGMDLTSIAVVRPLLMFHPLDDN